MTTRSPRTQRSLQQRFPRAKELEALRESHEVEFQTVEFKDREMATLLSILQLSDEFLDNFKQWRYYTDHQVDEAVAKDGKQQMEDRLVDVYDLISAYFRCHGREADQLSDERQSRLGKFQLGWITKLAERRRMS